MKTKPFLMTVLSLLALACLGATIQWYSQQPLVAPANDQTIAVEKTSPKAYGSMTLGTLKSWINSGVAGGDQVWTNFQGSVWLSGMTAPDVGTPYSTNSGPSFLFTSEGGLWIGTNVLQDVGLTAGVLQPLMVASMTDSNEPARIAIFLDAIDSETYAHYGLIDFSAAHYGNSGKSDIYLGSASTNDVARHLYLAVMSGTETNTIPDVIRYKQGNSDIFTVDYNGLVSSSGYQDSSLSEGSIVAVGPSGRLINTNVSGGSQVWTNDAGKVYPVVADTNGVQAFTGFTVNPLTATLFGYAPPFGHYALTNNEAPELAFAKENSDGEKSSLYAYLISANQAKLLLSIDSSTNNWLPSMAFTVDSGSIAPGAMIVLDGITSQTAYLLDCMTNSQSVATINKNGVVSANGFQDASLSEGSIVAVGPSGRLINTNVSGGSQVWTNNGSTIYPLNPQEPAHVTIEWVQDTNNINSTVGFDFIQRDSEGWFGWGEIKGSGSYSPTTDYAQYSLIGDCVNTNGRSFLFQVVGKASTNPASISQDLWLKTNDVVTFNINTHGLASANGFKDSSLNEGSIVAVGPGGRLINTNVSGGSQVWTNDGSIIWPVDPGTNLYSLNVTNGSQVIGLGAWDWLINSAGVDPKSQFVQAFIADTSPLDWTHILGQNENASLYAGSIVRSWGKLNFNFGGIFGTTANLAVDAYGTVYNSTIDLVTFAATNTSSSFAEVVLEPGGTPFKAALVTGYGTLGESNVLGVIAWTNSVVVYKQDTNGLVSANGYQDSSLSEGYLVGVGAGGRLVITNAANVDNITIQQNLTVLSNVTVKGSVQIRNDYVIVTNSIVFKEWEWAGPSNNVAVGSTNRYYYTAYTPIAITNLSPILPAGFANHAVLEVTNAASTNITITVYPGIRIPVEDTSRTYTLTNGNVAACSLEVAMMGSNSVVRAFKP